MSHSEKKPGRQFKRSRFKDRFCPLFTFIILFWSQFLFSQPDSHWIDIELIDTLKYTAVSQSAADSPQGLPSNLFDADYATSWMAEALFIRMPEGACVLNIYPKYARSNQMKISIYGGINPDGYVSEKAVLFKSLKYKEEQSVAVHSESCLQSVPLEFSKDALKEFLEKCRSRFLNDFDMPIAEISLIMKLDALNEICLSELFFNDRFMSGCGKKSPEFRELYVNEKENALLAETGSGDAFALYRDTKAVLQLLEVSKDNKWATLISMPAEIQGRVETSYLLVDLMNRRVVNDQLAQATGNYVSGNEMFLKEDDDKGVMLTYVSAAREMITIELK
jgi:hypothetical protein